MNSIEELLSVILQLAHDMLVMGSEVSRAEQKIEKMCFAYGMEEVEVFVITSSIVVSVKAANGRIYTQTKRIRKYNTDFEKLLKIEQLTDYVCKQRPEPEEIVSGYSQITKGKSKRSSIQEKLLEYGNYCCLCMIFTFFFGGDIKDGISSFICGIFAKSMVDFFRTMVSNRFVMNMTASMCAGLAACLFYKVGFAGSVDKVIIGNIMLLIPGLAMINSFKDLVGGETISGLLRLVDSVVQAVAIALGFALVLLPMGV